MKLPFAPDVGDNNISVATAAMMRDSLNNCETAFAADVNHNRNSFKKYDSDWVLCSVLDVLIEHTRQGGCAKCSDTKSEVGIELLARGKPST